MQTDTVYRATKGNTDGSIRAGDLIYIDSRDDSLVLPGEGWLYKEELTPPVMDFECKLDARWKVVRTQYSVSIRQN